MENRDRGNMLDDKIVDELMKSNHVVDGYIREHIRMMYKIGGKSALGLMIRLMDEIKSIKDEIINMKENGASEYEIEKKKNELEYYEMLYNYFNEQFVRYLDVASFENKLAIVYDRFGKTLEFLMKNLPAILSLVNGLSNSNMKKGDNKVIKTTDDVMNIFSR